MTQEIRPLRYIRKNFDWEEYINTNFSVKNTSNPNELRVCCPKCGEIEYKCYINTDRKLFNCFKCKFSSGKDDVVSFVSAAEGISKIDAIKKLAHMVELTTPTQDELETILDESLKGFKQEHEEKVLRPIKSLPECCIRMDNPEDRDQKDFFTYLYDRGLTFNEINGLSMYCVPDYTAYIYRKGKIAGNLGRRVLWPIYGGDNDLVSWVSRTIEPDTEPKYLNLPESDLKMTLWPYVEPYKRTAVIVEGIIDAYAVRRIPKTSAYATFGKHVTEYQVDILKKWNTEKVILFWDKRDAKPEMRSAVEKLKVHFKEVCVASQNNIQGDMDAGDLLKVPNGSDILQEALRPVDVYSFEYTKWLIT